MVALSFPQLVYWTQVIEHAPERFDSFYDTYLTEVGEKVTCARSFGRARQGKTEGMVRVAIQHIHG